MQQTPIHEVHNAELFSLMNAGYSKVVEVGSSSGAMARAYREQNPGCSYVGIEIDSQYAAASARYCTQVLTCNVEQLPDAELVALCDANCWVFGDALEHLYDPWKLLRRIAQWSAPGTEVVASIPNAQYWGIQSVLNCGAFVYQDAGLLDRTHIRWFTRMTMFALFADTGYQVNQILARTGNQPSAGIQVAIRSMAAASGADAELALADAIPFQYVLRAVKIAPSQANA